ncbi:unnamed protein product [Leptidea sinapis]|uniref:Uncharacterized protein n=1 Tax=Leptidea sinapis TaxID=189913 RepID=A0A5E4PT73_9NEOP|nr:unnamed protein product [Leptidea sinapis]
MLNETSSEIMISASPHVLSYLGQAAAKLAYYNFEWRYVTLVLFGTLQYAISPVDFLKHYDKSAVVATAKYRPTETVSIPQCVIFWEDISEISELTKWLVSTEFNRAGKYIIVCSTVDLGKCDEISVFKTMAKLVVPHVIFLKADNRSEEIRSYTYKILQPDTCFNDKPVQINISLECPNVDCFKALFSERMIEKYKEIGSF